jgi:hypothetical protein
MRTSSTVGSLLRRAAFLAVVVGIATESYPFREGHERVAA